MGQDYAIDFKHWSIKDGLSDRQVNGIFEDSRGFIWICTNNGFNCFDGYTFRVFSGDKDGLPYNCFYSMAEDPEGLFWIVGSPGLNQPSDICIFDPYTRKISTFREKTGIDGPKVVNYIQQMNDSLLLFGDRDQNYFYTRHQRLGISKITFPVTVKQVITTSFNNTIWVQNDSFEMCEIDIYGKLVKKIKTNNAPHKIKCYINNLLKPDFRTTPANKLLNPGPEIVEVNGLGEIKYPTTFNTGVDSIIYDQGKLIHPHKGIIADFIKDGKSEPFSKKGMIFNNNNGKMWFSSGFGLYLLTISKNKFRKYFYQDRENFNFNSYRKIVIDNNHLFALNEFTGICQANIDTNNKNMIAEIPQWPKGNFALIKTNEQDIFGIKLDYSYLLKKNEHKWILNNITEGMKGLQNIWSIYQLNADSFLLGTNFGLRLYSLKLNSVSEASLNRGYPELLHAIVLDISKDRTGQVWICTNSGFYAFNPTTGFTARYSSSDTGIYYLPASEFQHFCQDAAGIYWLGTTKGLIKWDKKTNTKQLITRKDGLSNNNIYAVYDDGLGRLWMTSDYGLMKYNKTTGNVKTYLEEDGITYNEFNRVSHTRDSAGNLYFGTLNGITAFNPKDFPEEETQNPILSVFTYEQFNGTNNLIENKTSDLLRTNTITLNPGDRFFNIHYALLTYNDAIHNTYFYKIDGIDSGWNSTNDPFLRISGLPYGKMVLHIKAISGNGSRGRNELNFNILVKRPVYLRIWFITLMGFVLVGGSFGLYRWRLIRLKAENERLDRIVRDQTSALKETISQLEFSSQQKDLLMKEIHHRVKNNLQVINVLLNLQLDGITDEAARKSIEEGISRISSIALIHHQLYRSNHIEAIELSSFASELLSQVASIYEQPGQKIILENLMPEILLDIDTALPIGLILNELMTNSFKYAFISAGKCIIKVMLEKADSGYRLRYCDNGPGLPDNYQVNASGSLGMVIIKNLTRQLAGNFDYHKNDNCFIINFKDTSERKNID